MKVAFDPIAIDYDLRFSLSPIGKIQRSQVYKFLTPWIHSVKTGSWIWVVANF